MGKVLEMPSSESPETAPPEGKLAKVVQFPERKLPQTLLDRDPKTLTLAELDVLVANGGLSRQAIEGLTHISEEEKTILRGTAHLRADLETARELAEELGREQKRLQEELAKQEIAFRARITDLESRLKSAS